jgi:hypothetical protein
MGGELLVAKDLALGCAQDVGKALMLWTQHERAVVASLDKLIRAGDTGLTQRDPQ